MKPSAEIESSLSKTTENHAQVDVGGGLPAGYTPVVALEPLKPFEAFETKPLDAYISSNNSHIPDIIGSSFISSTNQRSKESVTKAEIEEGKAKSTLKEIISEIDMYAEKDRELKDSELSQAQQLESFNSSNQKVGTLLCIVLFMLHMSKQYHHKVSFFIFCFSITFNLLYVS